MFSKSKTKSILVTDNDSKFEVSLDTHGFKPEDLQIKVTDNVIHIEAKTEEKKSDDRSKSYASRHLSRSYTLPKGCKAEDVTSNLSSDGVLMVSAPKMQKALKDSRSVPIQRESVRGEPVQIERKTVPKMPERRRIVASKLIKE